ncbi:MAG: glycosyltransferase family 4 protein [Hyphomicrobium sp.]
MTQAAKLLIVCAQCDGEDVGESWCGHAWASRIARRFDVTLLTLRFPGHRPPSEQLPGVRVIEWDASPFLARYPRFNSAVKPWYPLFYRAARHWIRKALHRGERFDLLHHLTPMALRYPSPCVGLGVPYVIGPVSGSVETPAGFEHELESQPRYMRLRDLDTLRLRYDPMLRGSFTGAATVICSAPYVARRLAGLPLQRVVIETEVGIDGLGDRLQRDQTGDGHIRLLHVGRVIRTKGLRDGLRALAQLGDLPGVTLDVAGDGEDMPLCQAEARRLGIEPRVRFLGRVPHSRIDDLYRAADLFLFPSFREATGIVLFEAMRHGLPVIAADAGGPGYIVDEASGVRIAPHHPAQFANDLAGAIRALVSDTGLRHRLGAGARTRSLELGLWDAKITRLAEIYDEAIARARRTSDQEGIAGTSITPPAIDAGAAVTTCLKMTT